MIPDGITAIIVDDEQPSRTALANYLTEFCPNVRILEECSSAESAYDRIMELTPQLVFLDIQLPSGNAFELLKRFECIGFKIIFVTAFSQYAIQALHYSATDYLLKPIKVTELIEAVQKVSKELRSKSGNPNIQVLLDNLNEKEESEKKLVIADTNGFQVLKSADIVFCEAKGYCTLFYLAGHRVTSSSRNLKYYENLLPASKFMRVHNSYLINLDQVQGYLNTEEIILSEGHRVPLSGSAKKEFVGYFKRFK
jgi:two-component system LytT family response regulator